MATFVIANLDPELVSMLRSAPELADAFFLQTDDLGEVLSSMTHFKDDIVAIAVGYTSAKLVPFVERAKSIRPDIDVVIVVADDNIGATRSAVQNSPFLRNGVSILARSAPERILTALDHAQDQAARRRRHQKIVLDAQSRVTTLTRPLPSATNLLGRLLQNAPIGVVLLDGRDRIVDWNETARGILGAGLAREEGAPLTNLFPKAECERLRALLEKARSREPLIRDEFESRSDPDRSVIIEIDAARVLGPGDETFLQIVIQDITDRKRAEEMERERGSLERKMLETQKLESLAVMAGGVAHDFNNLLTSIICNVAMAKDDTAPDSLANELLSDVEQATERAASLCQQMLAYSGKGHFLLHRLHLNEVIRETTPLLHAAITSPARLEISVPDEMPAVRADAEQLNQLLLNLTINAAEAIDASPGTIHIRCGTHRATDSDFSKNRFTPSLPPGEYALLEICDTGSGIDEKIRHQIFDPFFSTKFTGRGLGLAAVQGIVRGHKGSLCVQSEAGGGTTFRILLPFDSVANPEIATEPLSAPDSVSGEILVVDDEEIIRKVTQLALEREGFTVRLACDGRDATDQIRESSTPPDLVLLDLTMPRLDGVETFLELRKIRPDIPVLMMSGFNKSKAIERFTSQGPEGFIQKPFTSTALVNQIKQVLKATPEAAAQDRAEQPSQLD